MQPRSAVQSFRYFPAPFPICFDDHSGHDRRFKRPVTSPTAHDDRRRDVLLDQFAVDYIIPTYALHRDRYDANTPFRRDEADHRLQLAGFMGDVRLEGPVAKERVFLMGIAWARHPRVK